MYAEEAQWKYIQMHMLTVTYLSEVELFTAYWSCICIPLSFLICSKEKRELIWKFLPIKWRTNLKKVFIRKNNQIVPVSSVQDQLNNNH